MTKLILPFIILQFSFYMSIAQDNQLAQLLEYKKLYQIADSLNKAGNTFNLDSNTLADLKGMEKVHPAI